MKRFKDWLRHNTMLKLIALILAFFIWLVVVNSSNPKVTGSTALQLDVLNETSLTTGNQIYTLSTEEITVSYKVRQKDKSLVTDKAFNAYIDLDDYKIGNTVPVYLETDASVSDLITDVSASPQSVHVYTESIQQKKFAVVPSVTGTPQDGYIAGEPEVNPEYIYVKGPVSMIGQISSVGILIDCSGASSDIEGTTTVQFLDANGNELNGIENSLSFAGDISFLLPVYRIKTLSVNAFTSGAPASGYIVDSVETSPTFISVYGPEDLLKEYSYILISGNALNINGATENVTFNVKTEKYIPEGLKLAVQTPEITVYVKIRSIFDTQTAVSLQQDSKEEPESAEIPNTETAAPSAAEAETAVELKTEETEEQHAFEESSADYLSPVTGEEESPSIPVETAGFNETYEVPMNEMNEESSVYGS